jgi:hypothetical protein
MDVCAPPIRLGPPVGKAAAAASTLLALTGAALMVLGWYQASGTFDVDRQLDGASVGLTGLALTLVALITWLAVSRRAVAARSATVVSLLQTSAPAADQSSRPSAAMPPGTTLVASARMLRYHRDDCQLVEGKTVAPAGRRQHEAAGRRPCGVCLP